ncbi:metal ABC transporter ATP-binding protein [Frigoribacterium sp. VKM Ac-1396]|uniref:zinc ABC transporter ATP-binding protein AztA n=1 Tax=Frigoribacterium sp. VKM Ac-1396 TaxID=2783821 RepID=UPI00188B6657|nr:zinc ABC transporter ATP-binding protein AztA [Frigoribacterium sp. VKM Ac-1396]MBF4600505.1 metal ABC transporter ATP-binding protein [Frigoribacterium sp. VKM Ac-1396]
MTTTTAAAPSSLARLRGVGVAFGDRVALADVDLDVVAGALTVVAGPNGAGKSTLLEVVAGVRPPTSGTRVVTVAAAFVPQRTSVSDRLPVTVRDVVTVGTWGRVGRWRPLDRPARAAVDEALDRLDVTDLAHRPFAALSGGQRQRALLAHGLARGADLLLLDEPTTGLDAGSGDCIRATLLDQAADGVAVLVVSHDPALIGVAHRVVRLEAGRVVGASRGERGSGAWADAGDGGDAARSASGHPTRGGAGDEEARCGTVAS